MRYLIAPLLLLALCLPAHAQDEDLAPVVYVGGSVFTADSEVFSLLDGSRWLTAGYPLILPASDIFIVVTSEAGEGVAWNSGNRFPLKLLSGSPLLQSGWLGQVVKEYGDGAVLQLSDGSMWEIPQYDRYDTGYWLPPYWVIVTSDEMYLINVGKGKKIWATRVQ